VSMIRHRHEVPDESEVDVDRRGLVHVRMISPTRKRYYAATAMSCSDA